MDYEKAYKEAFERAKANYESSKTMGFIAIADTIMDIFPELRESEDERIRKRLIEYFEGFRMGNVEVRWEGLIVQEVLAWLEKQKINTEGDFGRGYDCGYEACLNSHGAEWFEKQKLSCWNSPVMTHEMIMNDPKEPHYTKRNALFDKCVENCDPKIMKRVSDEVDAMLEKEQKPVEPSDDELQRYQDELYDFKVFAAKQAREHHISFVHDFEWNNFCGEILSYFNEKQKSVWSKEDEMYLSQAIETLEHENYSILADKLKSLRPSWKPSEDEERLINTSISFLKDFADKGYENAVECIDWLKSKLNGNTCE